MKCISNFWLLYLLCADSCSAISHFSYVFDVASWANKTPWHNRINRISQINCQKVSNGPQDAKILITNNQELSINTQMLEEAAKLYRSFLRLNPYQLEVYIEGEAEMKKINEESFGKKSGTDIIAIRDEMRYEKDEFHRNITKYTLMDQLHLGEVYMCPSYIKEAMEKEESMKEDNSKG